MKLKIVRLKGLFAGVFFSVGANAAGLYSVDISQGQQVIFGTSSNIDSNHSVYTDFTNLMGLSGCQPIMSGDLSCSMGTGVNSEFVYDPLSAQLSYSIENHAGYDGGIAEAKVNLLGQTILSLSAGDVYITDDNIISPGDFGLTIDSQSKSIDVIGFDVSFQENLLNNQFTLTNMMLDWVPVPVEALLVTSALEGWNLLTSVDFITDGNLPENLPTSLSWPGYMSAYHRFEYESNGEIFHFHIDAPAVVAVSEVPLPGAAFLYGCTLLGLGFIKRNGFNKLSK